MTHKERIIAAVALKQVDRLPFWPKLDRAYENAWGEPVSVFHERFGSDVIVGIRNSFTEVRKKTRYVDRTDGLDSEVRYETPYGTLSLRRRFDPASQSSHPLEHPVKTKGDLEIMTAWVEDAEVVFDEDGCEAARQAQERIGGSGYTVENIGETSLMFLVEWLAGVEQSHYLLADYPGEVEALFASLHRNFLKRFEIAAEHSPADSLHLTENTSSTLISPAQYEKYCFPQISAYGEIAKAGGKPLMLHMCGHLKALLPLLSRLPASSFEAFTSPTVGNTSLLDGRTACPDKCLIGGTNATVWLRPAGEIIRYLEGELDKLPHHRGIVLTSAGVMPPMCEPDTIAAVKGWLDRYPARM